MSCRSVPITITRSVPTTIIGLKGLLRDSLVSLLGGYSYRVTDNHQTAADMPSPAEDPRMVLLIVRSVDIAVADCASIRRTCPNCKIVGLLEDILDEDFQKLAHSAMDGCVPLGVSQDVLARTLDLVMSGPARVVVLAEEPHLVLPSTEGQKKSGTDNTGGGNGGCRSKPGKTSAIVADHDGPPLVPNNKTSPVTTPAVAVSATNSGFNTGRHSQHFRRPDRSMLITPDSGLNGHDAEGFDHDRSVAIAHTSYLPATTDVPSLSAREKQIIDGLIKGQPNKTIARAYGITEATVKVHMKAILRKVPCSNRTQVAIWALAHADAFGASRTN
jgi:DNA-binding NarL/FixJ family response regulator